MAALCIVASGLALSSCGGDAQFERSAAPIIRGDADLGPERFPGVVWVQAPPRSCSGTLVAVQGSVGWVLTAAHCVMSADHLLRAPNYVVSIAVGADLAAQRHFPVVGAYLHPRYTTDRLPVEGSLDPQLHGPAHDLALVSFSGADASLAPYVIPPLATSEDALVVGSSIDIAGFGYTAPAGPAAIVRQAASARIAQIVTTPRAGARFFVIDQRGTNSGICLGDSGGPAVVTLANGERRVAGVLSFVTALDDVLCTEYGGIQTVSGEIDPFIRPVLSGQTLPPPATCLTCTFSNTQPGTHCFDVLTNALSSGASGYETCLERADERTCRASFPDGAAGFDAFWNCIQSDRCASQCTLAERAYFECREDFDGVGPCTQCAFAARSCCDLEARCRLDETCAPCMTRVDLPPYCATHALFRATYACVHASCAAECDPYFRYAGPPPDGGLELDAGGDATGEGSPTPARTGCGCGIPNARTAGAERLCVLLAALAWRRRRHPAGVCRGRTISGPFISATMPPR